MKVSVRQITFTAAIMTINIVFSSFGVPVGFAHLYLTDIAVCMAGILLSPFYAIVAGGVGAFLGDVIFYPQAMVTTLITRTVQVAVISVFSHYILKEKPFVSSLIGCVIGAFIMALGYTFLGAVFYKTLEASIVKMPLEFLQAAVGVVVALLVCYKFKIRSRFEEFLTKEQTEK